MAIADDATALRTRILSLVALADLTDRFDTHAHRFDRAPPECGAQYSDSIDLEDEREDRQHDEDDDEYVCDSHRESRDTARTDDVRSDRENDEHDRQRSKLPTAQLENGIGNGSNGAYHRPPLRNVVDSCSQTG